MPSLDSIKPTGTTPHFRIWTAAVLCLCGLMAVAGPVSAQTPEFQLVGFSTATATGDAGILGLNKLCHNEFPGSRLCVSDEVIATVNPTLEVTREYAWVHSKLVVSLSAAQNVYDATGKALSVPGHSPNCEGWSYQATWGMTITTDSGAAINRLCSESNRVACCAPTS